jgi:drug/metabolite transporter (DMT)-like permease
MYIAYSLMCFIYGTTFLAIKIGVDAGIPPFLFSGARFFLAGIISILFLWLHGNKLVMIFQNLKETAIVGILMSSIYFGALYWSEQHISSGLAALVVATAPIIVSLIQWNHNKAIEKWDVIGMLLGLLGVGISVYTSFTNEITFSGIAIFIILLGLVAYALGTVRSKKTLSDGVDPYLFNAYQMLFGSFVLLLLSILTEPVDALHFNEATIGALLYLTIFGSVIASGLYYWLVRVTNPFFPSTWTYISPIIAQFVGHFWIKEELSLYSFIGLFFVLLGVCLTNKDIRKKFLISIFAKKSDTYS